MASEGVGTGYGGRSTAVGVADVVDADVGARGHRDRAGDTSSPTARAGGACPACVRTSRTATGGRIT